MEGLQIMGLAVQPELKSLFFLLVEVADLLQGILALLLYTFDLAHVIELKALGLHLLLAHATLPLVIDHRFGLVPLGGRRLEARLQIFPLDLPLEHLLALFHEDLVHLELELLDVAVLVIEGAGELTLTI